MNSRLFLPTHGFGRVLAHLFMAAIRWSPFVQDAGRKWGDRDLPDGGTVPQSEGGDS